MSKEQDKRINRFSSYACTFLAVATRRLFGSVQEPPLGLLEVDDIPNRVEVLWCKVSMSVSMLYPNKMRTARTNNRKEELKSPSKDMNANVK